MAITTKLSDLIFGTPISNIEVPEHLNRTVTTGVDFVDSAWVDKVSLLLL